MPSKRVSFILALLATGLLLLLTWDDEPVRANASNLTLAHSLCLDPTCNPRQDGAIGLLATLRGSWQQPDRLNPCQRLWLSRIQSPDSPDLALSTLETATSCPRKYLLWTWAGILAWNQGIRDKAGEQWAQLPASILVDRSYALMLAGDVERGRYILNLVLRDRESNLAKPLRQRLYARLGDSYRLEAQWPQAVPYYEQAFQLDPKDIETRFFLGQSLRGAGQPGKAVLVLEGGLIDLPEDREYFVSSYLVQLGLAYQDENRHTEAAKTLESAREWLAREDNPNQAELDFIQQLIDHLEPPD